MRFATNSNKLVLCKKILYHHLQCFCPSPLILLCLLPMLMQHPQLPTPIQILALRAPTFSWVLDAKEKIKDNSMYYPKLFFLIKSDHYLLIRKYKEGRGSGSGSGRGKRKEKGNNNS